MKTNNIAILILGLSMVKYENDLINIHDSTRLLKPKRNCGYGPNRGEKIRTSVNTSVTDGN